LAYLGQIYSQFLGNLLSNYRRLSLTPLPPASVMVEIVSAIVVGAGFGGLATAIELRRKGCKVKVFEAVKNLDNKGSLFWFRFQTF
jgi:NADPH-dependent 2,4-dienoyl-CoA reductase/sulfur reductase-like enzyme